MNEVQHSLLCGAPAEHVIFDSPCKVAAPICHVGPCTPTHVFSQCDSIE